MSAAIQITGSTARDGSTPSWARRVLQSWRWIGLLALMLGLLFQGSRGLWEPDEGRYTQVALEMLARGDYLTPYRHHHHIHPTKPPLTYWLIAGSVRLFGQNEWAVRAPYALAFALTVLAVFAIGRRLTPTLPGLPAALYASMLLPFLATNVVTTDVFLALFVCAGLATYVHADAQRGSWPIRLMWLAFGFAFLTKGPPALLSLLSIVVAHRWQGRRWRELFDPIGLLGFALIAFTWFALVVWRNPGLAAYLVEDEVIARVLSDKHGRSPQWWGGLYVYGGTLLLGSLPWWPTWLRHWRAGPWSAQARANLQPADRLLLCWLLIPLAVFLLARSRLPLYLLPIFPALALLTARLWLAYPTLLSARLRLIPIAVIVLLAIKFHAAGISSSQDMRAFATDIRERLPFTPTELVFIESKPKYGLGFYFQTEVEWIGLNPDPDSRHDDTLTHELIEPEGARLYLLKPQHLAQFEARVSALGHRVEAFGETHGYLLLGLRRNRDFARI